MKIKHKLSVACGFSAVLMVSIILVASATRHILIGGNRISGKTKAAIIAVASLPGEVNGVYRLMSARVNGADRVENIYRDYNSKSNSGKIAGYLIIPYLSSNNISQIAAINLINYSNKIIFSNAEARRKAIYTDVLVGSESRRHSEISSFNGAFHPHLSSNGDLTYNVLWNDLVSIDLQTGREKWRVRGSFHHSIETDTHGNYWVCASIDPGATLNPERNTKHSNSQFEDQAIVNVSQSGKIIDSISVANLLVENHLEHLLYGVSNPNLNPDPIHLNHVNPINNSTSYFTEGQLLVSLRNLSTILLVEPRKRKVLWHKTGPWMNQHCVILNSDSKISIFDNHSFASGEFWLDAKWRSRVVSYDFSTGSSGEVVLNAQSPRDFKVPYSGRVIRISDGEWVLEDSVVGTVLVFKDQKLIYKWSNNYSSETVGVTSWSRFIPERDASETLKVILN